MDLIYNNPNVIYTVKDRTRKFRLTFNFRAVTRAFELYTGVPFQPSVTKQQIVRA